MGRERLESATKLECCFLSPTMVLPLFQAGSQPPSWGLGCPFSEVGGTRVSKSLTIHATTRFQSLLQNAAMINSGQTRCIVNGEAQKSALFWPSSGGFDFLKRASSLGINITVFCLTRVVNTSDHSRSDHSLGTQSRFCDNYRPAKIAQLMSR